MNKRGPKAKPKGVCDSCGKSSILTRCHCRTCYVRKLRRGELQKLEHKQLPLEFTDKQKSYLTGSLLGDGCLYKHKSTHLPYFAVHRKKEDLVYSKWETALLEDFVCKWWDGKTFDSRTNKTYEWVKLRTHRCEHFSLYYDAWYPDEIKIVPPDIELDALALAVWFADDGYVRETSIGRLQLKLSTHGFDLKSVELLTNILENRYNEYFGITLENGITPVIYASNAASWLFCQEIDTVFPPIERKHTWTNVIKRLDPAGTIESLRKTKNGVRKS